MAYLPRKYSVGPLWGLFFKSALCFLHTEDRMYSGGSRLNQKLLNQGLQSRSHWKEETLCLALKTEASLARLNSLLAHGTPLSSALASPLQGAENLQFLLSQAHPKLWATVKAGPGLQPPRGSYKISLVAGGCGPPGSLGSSQGMVSQLQGSRGIKRVW